MPQELRHAYHQDLAEIDSKVSELFGLVVGGLSAASQAFLTGDRAAAKDVLDQDRLIDSLYQDIEALAQAQFALQGPMATDLRFLLAVLRIVPELERSGDLAEHIAQRAVRGLTSVLEGRVRSMLEGMGEVALEMWQTAARAWAERDPEAYEHLIDRDDELDDLQVSLTAELASGSLSIPIAVELALVTRFYERLGDHSANVARRVRYLVTGEL